MYGAYSSSKKTIGIQVVVTNVFSRIDLFYLGPLPQLSNILDWIRVAMIYLNTVFYNL